MPIDSSIYGNIKGPPQLDINSLISTARAAQQLQGESAIGDIYKDAATGDPNQPIDAGKLGTLAPRAGVLAPAIAQQSQGLAQGQQTIDRNKLDNIREWWKTLDSELYSHMNDPDLNHKKVLDSIHGLIGHRTSELNGGIFTPQLATQASSWLWGPDGKPLAPDKIRKVLGQFHQRVQGNLASSEYVKVGVGPNGEDIFMTRNGAIARDANFPRGGAGAGTGGGPAAPPAPGRAGGAPGAAGAGVVPQPGGAPAVPFTPPAGYSEAASGIGAQSARAANALTEANDTSMVRKGMLGNLEDDLGRFTAGPSADWTRFAKAWVNRNLPMPSSWQFDPKSIASQEAFNKQAAMLAQSQFAAIGGTGTDAKFESAFKTSPNETLSQLGNKGIISLLKGNEDAIQAKNRSWQDWLSAGHGPQTYAQFSQEFNSHFDPRVFQFQYLSSKERQGYLDKMDVKDQARLLHDMTYARKQGWVNYGEPAAEKPAAKTPRAAPASRSAAPAPPAAPSAASAAPPVPAAPAAGSFEDRFSPMNSAPPVPGAKPGRHSDGSPGWFVPDPSRPGKYLAVT